MTAAIIIGVGVFVIGCLVGLVVITSIRIEPEERDLRRATRARKRDRARSLSDLDGSQDDLGELGGPYQDRLV